MSRRSVLMDSLDLWISDHDYAFVFNALSFMFADVLKNYACQKITKHLDENVGFLVQGLNAALVACAPHLSRLGFSLPVPEARVVDDAADIVEAMHKESEEAFRAEQAVASAAPAPRAKVYA